MQNRIQRNPKEKRIRNMRETARMFGPSSGSVCGRAEEAERVRAGIEERLVDMSNALAAAVMEEEGLKAEVKDLRQALSS